MAFEQVLLPQTKKDRADSFFRNPNPFNSYTENSPLAFTGIARIDTLRLSGTEILKQL
jgi:hypothetical protein